MQKQIMQFAVQTKDGIVERIGKSSIIQPKTNYSGKGTKWYQDKPKTGKERK